jgi:hypothetical protein
MKARGPLPVATALPRARNVPSRSEAVSTGCMASAVAMIDADKSKRYDGGSP